MAEIDALVLAKAIRAVDDKIFALQAEIERADPNDTATCDLEHELLGYMKAATGLRTGYEAECQRYDNLLPYQKLVRPVPYNSQQANHTAK